jgi:hypothetical protein
MSLKRIPDFDVIFSNQVANDDLVPIWDTDSGIQKSITISALATALSSRLIISPPTNFVSSGTSTTSISLNWEDTSNGTATFELQKSLDGISYSPLIITTAGATSYSDTGLSDGIIYYYRIRSIFSNLTSPWVESSSVTWYNFANGLEFDSVNDVCSVESLTGLVFEDSVDTLSCVMYFKKIPMNVNETLFLFRKDTTQSIGFFHGGDASNVTIAFSSSSGISGVSPTLSKTVPATVDTVIQVYFTVDFVNKTLKLKVNDSDMLTSTYTSNAMDLINQFLTGQTSGGGMRVGDLIVWKNFIIPNEILDVSYNGGKGLDFSSYVENIYAHWKFDEVSGTTAADSSGNSRNQTLYNFTGVDADKWKTF